MDLRIRTVQIEPRQVAGVGHPSLRLLDTPPPFVGDQLRQPQVAGLTELVDGPDQ
ncbi:hypothetical protein [Actinoallomurus acaciae]|uniref:Uncharacterized protein n=1 Tax=Actinoallomurus acaciae TaxID=502577 RepID=A0ABV5YKY4_9ACTN